MKKNKFIKYGALFLILVVLFCCLVSAADTITVTVTNPDNVPVDFDVFTINDQAGLFGDNVVSIDPFAITVTDGYFEPFDLTLSNVPDGDYILFLTCLTNDLDSDGAFLVPSEFLISDQLNVKLAGTIDAIANIYVVPSFDNVELVVNEGSAQPVASILMIPAPPTVTESIENVWSGILTFVVDSLGSAGGLFYNSDTGLTFLGTLGIIGLSFGLGLLIFYFVSKFLRLRG